MRQYVTERLELLLAAQIDNAEGIRHLMRDPNTGKFEPLNALDAFRDLVGAPKPGAKPSTETSPQNRSASRTIRSAQKGPHIPLETQSQPAMREWVKIGLLMVIAGGVGVMITLLFFRR